MFGVSVQDLVMDSLAAYAEKPIPANLKINLGEGYINVANMQLKKLSIDQLALPFEVVQGSVKEMHVKLLLAKLASEAPRVSIEGVSVVLGNCLDIDVVPIGCFRELTVEEKKEKIEAFVKELLPIIIDKVKQDVVGKEKTFIQKVKDKIFDNLIVNIKNVQVQVNVREDLQLTFCFDELTAYTANDKWEQCIINRSGQESLILRKRIEVVGLSLFIAPQTCYNAKNYLLKPMNFAIQAEYNEELKTLNAKAVIPDLSLNLNKEASDSLVHLNETMKSYYKGASAHNAHRKHFTERPLHNIKEKPHGAKAWWRYAIRCVQRIHSKAQSHDLNSDLYRAKFMQVFIKLLLKLEVPDIDLKIYEKALFLHSMEEISEWIFGCVYQVERDKQGEQKEKQGFLGLFSWKAPKKEEKEVKESPEDKAKRLFELALKEIKVKKDSASVTCEVDIAKAMIELNTSIKAFRGQFSAAVLSFKKSESHSELESKIHAIRITELKEDGDESVNLISSNEAVKCFSFIVHYAESKARAHISTHGLTIVCNPSLISYLPKPKRSVEQDASQYSLGLELNCTTIVLPAAKDIEMKSSVWAVKIDKAKLMPADLANFELLLEHLNVEYYETYRDLAANEKAIPLVRDLSCPVLLSIDKTIKIRSDIDEICLILTPLTYKLLLNRNKGMPSKEEVMKISKKIDKVYIITKNAWKKYDMAIVGSCLYIYETEEAMPVECFCVENVVITQGKDNEFTIDNGERRLTMKTEQHEEWITFLSNAAPNDKRDDTEVGLNLAIKKAEVHLSLDKCKPWAVTTIHSLKTELTASKASTEGTFECSQVIVEQLEHPLCSTILSFKDQKMPLALTFHFQPNEPKATIKGQVPYMQVLFVPTFVKAFVQYITNAAADSNLISTPTSCNINTKTIVKTDIKIHGATLICLHPQYNTPVIKGAIAETAFGFSQFTDHLSLNASFGEIEITDMTNYPSTISPLNFPMHKTSLAELDTNYSGIKLVAFKPPANSFTMRIYDPWCPTRAEGSRDDEICICMDFGETRGNYVHELTLRRVLDYVLEQVVYSLSAKEADCEGGEGNCFAVPKEFTRFKCVLGKSIIELKPRAEYEAGVVITADGFLIANKINFEHDRYLTSQLRKAKSVCCNVISITGTNVSASYLGQQIVKPFALTVESSNPLLTSNEFARHNSKAVNLSRLVKVAFDETLHVALDPRQINFFLQCVALNVAYADELDDYFWFIQDKLFKLTDCLKFEANVCVPQINLSLLDADRREIAEIQAQRLDIKELFYWNEDSQTTITAASLLIKDLNAQGVKTPMVYSLDADRGKFMMAIDITLKQNKEVLLNHYSAKVTWEEYLYVFKLNTLHALLQAIELVVPDYEAIPYKPYKYYEILSTFAFELEMANSTILAAGENKSTAIALEGSFLLHYNKNGFQDILGDKLLRMETGESDPYRDLLVSFKDTSAVLRTWQAAPDEHCGAKDCAERLLAERVKSVDVYRKEAGLMKSSSASCTSFASWVVDVRGVEVSATCGEVLCLLEILCSQLKHFSSSFLKDVKEFYKREVPKLHNVNIPTNTFTYNPAIINFETFKEAILYYAIETERIEKLRQEYLRLNIVKAKQLLKNKQGLLKTSMIFEYKTTIECSIEAAAVRLMCFLNDFYSPLLMLRIPKLALTNLVVSKSENLNVLGQLSVDYYNEVASAWEPLIESFILELNSRKKSDDQSTDVSIKDCININITEEFIKLVHNCKKYSMLHYSIAKGTKDCLAASSYAIDNQSGEALSVTYDQKSFTVNSNEKLNLAAGPYESHSDELIKHKPLKVKIDFDSRLEVAPVTWPDLSSTGSYEHKSRAHCFSLTNKLANTQKVLTVATDYQLSNELDIPIAITFYPSNAEPEQFALNPRSGVLSVPTSLVNVPAAISVQGDGVQTRIVLSKLKETLVKESRVQVALGKDFFVVFTLSRVIHVWPPYCIQNFLPLPVTLEFKGKSITIQEMQSKLVYFAPVEQKGKFLLTLFTQQLIDYDLSKEKYLLTPFTESGVTVNMQIVKSHTAYCTFVFYADYVIKNFTRDNLIFFSIATVKLRPESRR